MHVFDVIPKNYFSILTGRNQEIYLEALLQIHQAFRQSLYLTRDQVISLLIDRLADLDCRLDWEAEAAETQDAALQVDMPAAERDSWSGMAHALLRRLVATGWVELETRPQSFEQLVTLPPYSLDLLDVLSRVTTLDTQAYRNYAFATYSALKTMVDPTARDYAYTALLSATENCQMLQDALKSLLANIRRFHSLLSDYVRANDILKGHFEDYQVLVNERIFHPMVTRDSVLRFKQPVLQLVEQALEDDACLAAMCEQAVREKHEREPDLALEAILQKIQGLGDIFSGIDGIMAEIQVKNSAYTRASTDKLLYLLNQDRSLKDKLARILLKYQELLPAQQEELGRTIRLHQQAVVDSQSLFTRTNRRIRSSAPPLKVVPVAASADDLADFLRSTSNRYSHDRVMAYMQNLFGTQPVVPSEEITPADSDQFVLLMLAVLKAGESRVFYTVEFLDGQIERGGYRFPRMRFVRLPAGAGYRSESGKGTVS